MISGLHINPSRALLRDLLHLWGHKIAIALREVVEKWEQQ